MTPSPTQSQIAASLRTFLLDILPSGVDVIAAQENKVPEPTEENFVVMTEIDRIRIETNVDTPADVRFTGSISGTTLTVSTIDFGEVEVGATVSGTGVTTGTKVMALAGGTGGIGAYTVSPSQIVPSAVMSTGAMEIVQPVMIDIQLDVHGPDSSDNSQTISTLMRDDYAVRQFAEQSPNYGVVPLYADDPAQRPFINEAQQYETRWVIDCKIQVNPVISAPQQFADELEAELIDVDVVYPP